ncbi:MAG: NAD(P)H-hydrate dehydratase [Nocardiaceae bacterium]|nr:NAD(P)H-hydrate dehydratase [Nocardiaceae bacterium]
MRTFFNVDEIRGAEAVLFGEVPAGVPMQRAAYGLARVIAAELTDRTGGVAGRRVGLLVGSGDNGGDVLWAGAMLRRRGVAVSALLFAPDRAHAAGLAALRRAGGRVVDEFPLDIDLAIDGIVGISGHGSLRPEAARVVAAIEAPIIAADLPSGVEPDTGAITGPAVRAAVTVTFGGLKPVHALAPEHCGRVELIPIGLRLPDPHLRELEAHEAGRAWPVPGALDDKYSGGVVGVRAGSAKYPGAALLAVGAAVAATSPMVRYCGPAAETVVSHLPEVIATTDIESTGKVQAWVVGPGLGTDEYALEELKRVLAQPVPVLVDADGITLLAAHTELLDGREAPTLVTPHAGEFARLSGAELGPDRVSETRRLADTLGVTVLLKGRATVITAPGGPVWVNDAGSSWAATAGSGDVLSGLIGALLASGIEPDLAAAMGCRAHSVAARLAATNGDLDVGAPISAGELLSHLRPAIRVLRSGPEEIA